MTPVVEGLRRDARNGAIEAVPVEVGASSSV